MFAQFFISAFNHQPKGRVFGFALLLMLVVGWLDYLTGSRLFFDIFYLIPVTFAAWLLGRSMGLGFAVASALTGFIANMASGGTPGFISVELWNFATRIAFFMLFAQLSNLLKNKLENETQLARTDFLTGAGNARAFYDFAEMEMSRSKRSHQPLSLAYIDLDNFKKVNDTRGHAEGDKVLKTVVATLRQVLRASDFVARLGGDEFAVLLPETDYVQSKMLAQRLRVALLKASDLNSWPVTFSIGVLTCLEPPSNLQSLVEKADALMYKVKASGKDSILHSTFQKTSQVGAA